MYPQWEASVDNPKYISWNGCHKSKGLKLRIQQVLAAAQSYLALRPPSIILFFANGLASHVYNQLRDEFGASVIMLDFSVFSTEMLEETNGDWINVIARSYRDARVLEINPSDSIDVFPNLGCNVQVSTSDSSQLEISVGKAETPLQQELSIDKAEIRLQLSQENIDKNLDK